jgi:hypothetical protein
MGRRFIGHAAADIAPGSPRAFAFADGTTGTGSAIVVYVGAHSKARRLTVGLYSNKHGHPGSRLASGSLRSPTRKAWDAVPISAVHVRRGVTYWIAILGRGGVLRLRANPGGRCSTDQPRHPLLKLPSSWKTGQRPSDCRVSAYLSGGSGTVLGGPGIPVSGSPSPVGAPSPTSGGGGPPSAVTAGLVSAAYYAAWEDTSGMEATIPWSDITELDLMAVEPCYPGAGSSSDCPTNASVDTDVDGFRDMNVASWVNLVHAHGKLALLAIGGSSVNGEWYYPCEPSNAGQFASNLVSLMQQYGFDGINIDMEQDPGSGSPEFTTAMFDACLQDISSDLANTTTAEGKRPVFTGYADPTTNYDIGADEDPYVSYILSGGYGHECNDNCSAITTDVSNLESKSGIPSDKIVIGIDTESGDPSCCYDNLATTSGSVSEPSTNSIPVSGGLSAAIPAGNVVIASTQNPPTDWEILTTSGAAQGATSIPITGTVAGSGSYTFPSGSDVQDDYAGPWDFRNIGEYAANPGNDLKGVMVWTLGGDYDGHNGQYPSFVQLGAAGF